MSDCVVNGVDFSQGTQSKIQEGAITLSTKESSKIIRDKYLSPRVSYCSKYLGCTCNFGWRSEVGDCYARRKEFY